MESGQVQRYPRATSYAYLLGGLIFILLGVVLLRKSSEWWTGVLLILLGVGVLVAAYYSFRYRLTATGQSIVIYDLFRGEITINRQNSTWRYAGRRRGHEATTFTLDDRRKVTIYSPQFDIRTYTENR
ncbi:MAG: hypothetical protein MR522_06490 [Trueperella sp.]|uniref:hypothetical protein n=1 Tax=Trueperella sp. TaxID=2699835 RepID=UPI0025FD67F2|nr:hypothetical protein [Trueperella sp.]MCI7305892.1 hypothetical protein [Trueperella sp.]